ncbi:TlpA family protein disulfide reductase [Hoylesella enoeca]|uniref:TlpA family protein disulfide reductase n=1 Tax=Hoylesella enoeca TaxID=76123 RepID=UPI001F2B9ABA|nr:thioredoxin family protein [Hoylesella enoeca]
MPKLKQLYTESCHAKTKLTLVSVSLDKDEAAWRKALKTFGINSPDWIQARDIQGTSSPSAKLFGVREIPMNVLIDPEGKAISLTLQGDELLTRVRQILSGDLYYQQETPKK